MYGPGRHDVGARIGIRSRFADGGYLDPAPMGPEQKFSGPTTDTEVDMHEALERGLQEMRDRYHQHREINPEMFLASRGYHDRGDLGLEVSEGGISNEEMLMHSAFNGPDEQELADGGEVAPFEENYPEPEPVPLPRPRPQPPPEETEQFIAGTEGVPSYDPARAPPPGKPTIMEPGLEQVQKSEGPEGLDPEKYGIDEHGRIIDKKTWEPVQLTPRPSVLPLTKTPEGEPEFAVPKALDILGNVGGGWSVPVKGAEAVLGAGMALPKKATAIPPKAGEVGRTWFDLPPEQVKASIPTSPSMGTSPGGVYTGFADGVDRYVKQAKSLDHAKNEVLANKLYELWGVPVAKVELTQLGGKPAVASHIVPGKQLSEYGQWEYPNIEGLREHVPAHAMLANGDVIGAGVENPRGNVIVSNGKAVFIDHGGAIRYSGLGGQKTFDKDVGKWLDGLMNPYKNESAADAFHGHEIGPNNITAQKIANTTDGQFTTLVHRYGPTDMAAKEQLIKTLIARRDGIAKAYGIEPHPHIGPDDIVSVPPSQKMVTTKPKKPQTFEELQAEWEAKLAEPKTKVDEPTTPHEPVHVEKAEKYSFKDPEADAGLLLAHNWMGPKQFDAEGIAHDMYKMAEKNPEYVDQVYKKLPFELQDDVNAKLSMKIQREGDPWEAVKLGAPKASAEQPTGIGHTFKLMQLNKTHTPDQLVNSIKFYQKNEVNAGKTVTDKQKEKIISMISSAPTAKIAESIKGLEPELQKNVLSWLPPAKAANVKHLAKVSPEKAAQPIPDIGDVKKSHSLYQIIGAIKNYSPMHAEVPYHAYQGIPKEISKFSPTEIMKEMEGLSLTQKQKVMEWIPQSTQEKMAQIGAEKQAKKLKVDPEYHDALETVNWSTYKPKGVTSSRQMMSGPTLKKALEQGYNPDVTLYKGGKYQSYPPNTILDPVTEPHRLSNPDERAFFLSDRPSHTEAYGTLGAPYIARPAKVYAVDWKALTGSEDYNSYHMKRVIEAAREKGADLVIVKDVADVSGYGHTIQNQYAFLNTHVLRGPEAKFDANMMHLRIPLAGLVGGGLFSYGMVKGQEGEESKFASGGRIPVGQKIKRDAFLYMNPKPPQNSFAQCGTCRQFTGTGCLILGDTKITKDMACGLYTRGRPQLHMKGREEALVPPKEAGLVNFQVRCENCKYGGSDCQLYEMLNDQLPETFDLETKIDPKGCCNAFVRKGHATH
jgi:hypothetical protein